MWDTGWFDPVLNEISDWDCAVEDGPHEFYQHNYPNPSKDSQNRELIDITNTAHSSNLASISNQRRYERGIERTDEYMFDANDFNTLFSVIGEESKSRLTEENIADLLNVKIEEVAKVISRGSLFPLFDKSWIDEVAWRPYMRPYPTGCKVVCESKPIGNFVEETDQLFSFNTTGPFGMTIFQDDDSGGLLFWHDGSYYFYDVVSATTVTLFSSSIHLAHCALFGTTLLGSDSDGNVYHVDKTGLHQLTGGKGRGFALKDKYIVTSTGIGTKVFKVEDYSEVAENTTDDLFPWATVNSFSQNYILSDMFKQQSQWKWGITQDSKIAKINQKTNGIDSANGNGTYIHGTKGKQIFRDWLKAKECPSEHGYRKKYITLRNPCTQIALDIKTREFVSTLDWMMYKSTGVSGPSENLDQVIRLDSIKRLINYNYSISNIFDTNTRVNTSTVDVTMSIVNYS